MTNAFSISEHFTKVYWQSTDASYVLASPSHHNLETFCILNVKMQESQELSFHHFPPHYPILERWRGERGWRDWKGRRDGRGGRSGRSGRGGRWGQKGIEEWKLFWKTGIKRSPRSQGLELVTLWSHLIPQIFQLQDLTYKIPDQKKSMLNLPFLQIWIINLWEKNKLARRTWEWVERKRGSQKREGRRRKFGHTSWSPLSVDLLLNVQYMHWSLLRMRGSHH